ncbi:MAG: hypothetical protein KC609_24595 [Myxococcales bacterium]|nr:hypothetical protein [Myxococcales bacterium]
MTDSEGRRPPIRALPIFRVDELILTDSSGPSDGVEATSPLSAFPPCDTTSPLGARGDGVLSQPTLPSLRAIVQPAGARPAPEPLTRLDLSESDLTDFGHLASMTPLTELSLARTSIIDLTVLQSLTHLRALDLGRTRVKDLAPLARLYDLEELDISRTRVEDLSPLRQLGRLRILRLRDTAVRDLSSVRCLYSLELIEIHGCPIESLEPLKAFGSQLRVLLDQALIDRLRRGKKQRADGVRLDKLVGRPKPKPKTP